MTDLNDSPEPSENNEQHPHSNKPNSPDSHTSKGIFSLQYIIAGLAILALLLSGYIVLKFSTLQKQLVRQHQLILALPSSDKLLQNQAQLKHNIDSTLQIWQNKLKNIQQTTTDQVDGLREKLAGHQDRVNNLVDLNKQNFKQWVVAEVQHIIELSNIELNLYHNVPKAVSLLQMADTRLQAWNDPNLEQVREKIFQDLALLKAVQQPDKQAIVAQLDRLEQKVSLLFVEPQRVMQNQANQKTDNGSPRDWKSQVHNKLSGLKNLFIVRRLRTDSGPVLPPDQLLVVRENIRLKMSQAEWAVWQGDQQLFTQSLDQAHQWINQYFVQENSAAKDIAAAIEKISSEAVTVQLPNHLISLSEISHQLQQVLASQWHYNDARFNKSNSSPKQTDQKNQLKPHDSDSSSSIDSSEKSNTNPSSKAESEKSSPPSKHPLLRDQQSRHLIDPRMFAKNNHVYQGNENSQTNRNPRGFAGNIKNKDSTDRSNTNNKKNHDLKQLMSNHLSLEI